MNITGLSAVAGLWCGYETPAPIGYETNYSKTVWREIMTRYLADKDPNDDFIDDPNVVSRAYCKQTGKLAGDKCSDTGIGYYDISNLPAVCDGVHPNSSSSDLNSSQVASIPSSSVPSSIPSDIPSSEEPSSEEPVSSEDPSSSSSEPSSSEGTSSEPSASEDGSATDPSE